MNRLITSVICGLVGINTMLYADASRPKLVVGIMIDQLRTDYIEYLQNLFGEKGFNKLMKDGAFLKDVDFKVNGLDNVSGTAMIYTGGYPRHNGVTSSKVYDPNVRDMVPALQDATMIGNFTTETWATTTYYREAPSQLTQRNYSDPITSRLDTMQWKPSRPLSTYPGLPAQKRILDFKHTFPTADRSVYRMYISSPMVNTEVTDVAITCLRDLKIGSRGDAIDMLNIGYTAAPYKYVKDGDFRLELEDSYLRLDGQLSRLFDAIDKYVGLNNTLVYVASTGYYDDAVEDDAKYRTPTGYFSVKRALSLLNSYLAARYGNGDYVDTFSGGHVYLDRKQIEERKLDLKEVAEASRDFLVQMSGVSDAGDGGNASRH